jgi:hypothetical protein
LDHRVNLEVRERARLLGSELELMKFAFGVNFVPEEHFFRVVRADDGRAERLCGKAIDVVRVGVSEEM